MITPQYVQEHEAAQNPLPTGLDTQGVILERLKVHFDKNRKDINYGMRLVVANYLDITTDASDPTPTSSNGIYPDVLNKRWEEGRHNRIQNNTLIQTKSLVFSDPDIRWSKCSGKHPALVAAARRAYYLAKWRQEGWDFLYREKLLDLIISGESSVQAGFRDGQPFMEWLDSLQVTWDTSYKDPKKKRFVFVDKPMPLSDALRYYPALAGKVKRLGKDGSGGEEIVVITFYWSKGTAAVLYKNQFIEGPRDNPYGRIPVNLTSLIHLLSTKYPTGMVEPQMGSHILDLRLQRYFRETVLRGSPVGVLTGTWDENAIDDLQAGEEAVVLRSKAAGADFKYAQGAEIQRSAMELDERNSQNMNASSGVNDFMRSQTNTQVDFASQLAYIAQESGVQGKYTAQAHAEGLKEDARLFMEIAGRFQSGPVTLPIEDQDFVFDQFNPIKPLLGTDGEVEVKPMVYKSEPQKLQEAMILGQVMVIGNALPPPLQQMYWDRCLAAADIENKDDILAAVQDYAKQQQEAQAQAQQQQAQIEMAKAQGQSQGQPQPPISPVQAATDVRADQALVRAGRSGLV